MCGGQHPQRMCRQRQNAMPARGGFQGAVVPGGGGFRGGMPGNFRGGFRGVRGGGFRGRGGPFPRGFSALAGGEVNDFSQNEWNGYQDFSGFPQDFQNSQNSSQEDVFADIVDFPQMKKSRQENRQEERLL